MKSITIAALGIVCVTGPLLAQGRGTPPAPTTGRGAGAQKPRAAATSAARVMVRDPSGAPLPGVKVTLSGGDASAEEITNGFGAAVFSSLKDGTYRLRFDSTGFVPFEREFTVHAPQPITIETQLSAAPPPPAPPPPPKPVAPALGPAGPPVTLSIPNYLDKNLISGRDPLKES